MFAIDYLLTFPGNVQQENSFVTFMRQLKAMGFLLMSLLRSWDLPGKPTVNFSKVMEMKNSELERLSKLYKGNLDSAGVTFFEGRGKVTGPNSVEVNGKEYKACLFQRENLSCCCSPPSIWRPLACIRCLDS